MTGLEAMMRASDGEKMHEQQRKRFWNSLTAIGIGAVPIGGAMGFFAARNDMDLTAFWQVLPPAAAIAIVAAAVVLFSYGCWRFMKAIDEVELVDNLWGSTTAYYVYCVLFPAWWALAAAGLVIEPMPWIIFIVALGGGLLAYGWRKWRAR